MKIYIGCSLTHATDSFKEEIEELKVILRKKYEILDFLGVVNGTCTDVYKWDKNCVKQCDILIAECSHPSTGLGYEIGFANSLKKTIIGVAKKDATVTRMILGINTPNFSFTRYENNINEILPILEEKINKITK